MMEYTRHAERRLGRILVTREIEINPDGPITKWDVLSEWERGDLERTPFQDGKGSCSRCGEPLPTEAAFARHYVVNDLRYLNLGSCPNVWKPGDAVLIRDDQADTDGAAPVERKGTVHKLLPDRPDALMVTFEGGAYGMVAVANIRRAPSERKGKE